jgi:uncharacterized protein (DUF2252 family)
MSERDVTRRIHDYNAGRDPGLLERKYKAIRSDPFVFLRGTCHLFYEDWPKASPLNAAPAVWICGDLHLENYGSYKGDNRVAYFDLSDFDEAVLAPCTWEIARLLTSVLVAARSLRLGQSDALALCEHFLSAYAGALAAGHPRVLDRADASGLVKELLTSVKKRDRGAFLDKRTTLKKGRRRLIVDGVRATAVTAAERGTIEGFMASWAAPQPDPAFFKLLDVAHRIAGTGSLGVDRYVLLVEGRGSPDKNFLLDLKAANASALSPYVLHPQPAWASHAARSVAIQRRMQGAAPALLQPVSVDGRSFTLKELQPTQDRVALDHWNGKLRRLETVLGIMGQVTAWAVLRSGGRQGSAIADELIAFASEPGWKRATLDYARAYAAQVEADWGAFCASTGGS